MEINPRSSGTTTSTVFDRLSSGRRPELRAQFDKTPSRELSRNSATSRTVERNEARISERRVADERSVVSSNRTERSESSKRIVKVTDPKTNRSVEKSAEAQRGTLLSPPFSSSHSSATVPSESSIPMSISEQSASVSSAREQNLTSSVEQSGSSLTLASQVSPSSIENGLSSTLASEPSPSVNANGLSSTLAKGVRKIVELQNPLEIEILPEEEDAGEVYEEGPTYLQAVTEEEKACAALGWWVPIGQHPSVSDEDFYASCVKTDHPEELERRKK